VTYEYLEKKGNPETEKKTALVTVCGMAVRLVFAEKKNGEVPQTIGSILKGTYFQRLSV